MNGSFLLKKITCAHMQFAKKLLKATKFLIETYQILNGIYNMYPL